MTLQSSGPIAVADVNVEIGQSSTYSSDLAFLNNLVLPAQRPTSPNMAEFYGLTYFQNNNNGNCNSGNCNCSGNCGNINCNQCQLIGPVDCVNCDTQQWLQTNCNCACTYNCNYSSTSYACNCTCACGKIICTKLHELGYLPYDIFKADQIFGEMLRQNDPYAYYGYIKWASVVVDWIDGEGPPIKFWIKDKKKRSESQSKMVLKWTIRIATPWANHMAYKMGVLEKDNRAGRLLMKTGLFTSRLIGKLFKTKEPSKNIFVGYFMWLIFGAFWILAGVKDE